MADIDPSHPADDDIVSAYPSNERASRLATAAVIGAEHNNTTGRHKIPKGSTATRDGITNWETGSLFLDSTADPSTLQINDGTQETPEWIPIGQSFPSGTKMLFIQAAAPTGWTQDTSVNDRVLRIVNNDDAGETGGSWAISGISVDDHTLTAGEIPSHTHGMPSGIWLRNNLGGSTNNGQMPGGGLDFVYGALNTNAAGSGGAHGHTITIGSAWRPSYVNAMIAEKD